MDLLAAASGRYDSSHSCGQELHIVQHGGLRQVPEFQGRDDHLCFGVYPLVLGRQVIEHLRLYFATQEKALYFTAAQ